MRVIRRSCFETNSSSQHSIVVTTNDCHVTAKELTGRDGYNPEYVYVNSHGAINLHEVRDGYERYPFQILSTFEDKLQYALCEYLGRKYVDDPEYDEIFKEFENITKEVIPEFTHFSIATRDEDVWLTQDGDMIPHKFLIYDGWDAENEREIYTYKDKEGSIHQAILDEENCFEAPDIGQIDHQSAGMLKNFLKDRGISLKEFLTNKKYVIIVDGDEYCALDKLVYSGLFNRSAVVDTYNVSDEDLTYEAWRKEHESDS